MPKKVTLSSVSSSDLMIRKTRNSIFIPLLLTLLLAVTALASTFAGLTLTALITGMAALIPLVISILKLRKLMADSRVILNELAMIAEKNEEVINSFSHKIREPLNNLVMLGNMLSETTDAPKQQELSETFIASTGTMVDVVNELTMATAGNITFERRSEIRYRLGSIIRDTIELIRLNRKHGESVLVYDDRGEGEGEYMGDPIIIKQILIDLITAAISGAGGPVTVRLQVRIAGSSGEKEQMEFTLVSDRPVVFIGERHQPYPLAGRLIRESGGNWQESSAGQESFFMFHINVRKAGKSPQPVVASTLMSSMKEKRGRKELKELNVLLVEDNPINLRITQLMLEPLVRRIEVAHNGKEALDMFGTSRYDLILMDVQMPVMNGLLAAEKIRRLETSTRAHVPIIAITANAMLGDREQCLAVGMDDYISKPIEPEVLIEKITALV